MTDTEASDVGVLNQKLTFKYSPLSDSTLVADGDSFRIDDGQVQHVLTDKEALGGSEPQSDVHKKGDLQRCIQCCLRTDSL